MPTNRPTNTGVPFNSAALSAPQHRLCDLHKESVDLFRRAHKTSTTDEYMLEMLDESDRKLEQLMGYIKIVDDKIAELEKEDAEKGREKKAEQDARIGNTKGENDENEET